MSKKIQSISEVDEDIVNRYIDYLTLGSNGVKKVDPAIQPLIPINENKILLAPSLLNNNKMERNFIQLINKIPKEKENYLSLVSTKEIYMRGEIEKSKKSFEVRYFNGAIKFKDEKHDIDLAIISIQEKKCVLIELKWFQNPAEIREIIEKSQEIQEGVKQLQRLNVFIKNYPEVFYNRLSINTDYDIYYFVVSANSIGSKWIVDDVFPIINLDNFIEILGKEGKLNDVIVFFQSKNHLPTEGKQYRVNKFTEKINGWKLKWFGLELIPK